MTTKLSSLLADSPSISVEAKPQELILILDFGSQYSELIARRIREAMTYSELVHFDTPLSRIKELKPKGIILSGGPASVYEEGAPSIDPELWNLGIPVLGVCYGMQLMAHQLGGKVSPSEKAEYGKAALNIDKAEGLFKGFPSQKTVWMSHGDSIDQLPPGFEVIGHTDNTPVAAIAHAKKNFYGVQFHPEVVHTQDGQKMIANFVQKVCGCGGTWTTEAFIDLSVRQIREQVGDKRVLLGLSGGVDSSSLAFLLHKAIGDQLTCMFIDQGFMRKGEPEYLLEVFTQQAHLNVHYINARARFIERLHEISDPEDKRKRIGAEFVRVFEEEARKLGHFEFLAQGTLYPDVIESAGSATGKAVRIKSHHNVGGLPEDMQFKLVEPFKRLFKDEVRAVGRALGLPEDIVNRHPFPGPGLAIRILGEVTVDKLKILRNADFIVRDVIKKRGLYNTTWQAFAVLLPVRSVGVMGDKRTYSYPIVLRVVTSEDGMTADWAKLPYEVLEEISTRIVNEVDHVNRVVYDITSKPPGTIEWE